MNPLVRVRCAPHLALALRTRLARVQDTQPLEQATNPMGRLRNTQPQALVLQTRLVRLRKIPRLALVMGSPPAREQETPPLALVLGALLERERKIPRLAQAMVSPLARVQKTPQLTLANGTLLGRILHPHCRTLSLGLEDLHEAHHHIELESPLSPTAPPSAARRGPAPARSRPPCAARAADAGAPQQEVAAVPR